MLRNLLAAWPPGCTKIPHGPPVVVKRAIRARGARLPGPLPLVILEPRARALRNSKSIVRNPAIPARALLPRETDIRDLGALAAEVQKRQKNVPSAHAVARSLWDIISLPLRRALVGLESQKSQIRARTSSPKTTQ